MMKPIVSIVKGSSPMDITVKALEMIDADRVFPRDVQIVVKPNYVVAKHPSSGVTTDVGVVEGVLRFFRDRGFKLLAVAEGSGFADTFEAFKLVGVDRVAERYGACLIDLNRDELVEVQVPNALALRKIRVAKSVLEGSVVSVPKLKLHSIAKVTLSLKNLMGAVMPKGVMHGRLHEKIVDLASVVKPRLAVIDGVVGGAGTELWGVPVPMNLVVAGLDPVSVDSIGAVLMGLKPSDVDHIRLAAEAGLGVSDLKLIEVVGERIKDVQIDFRGVSNPWVFNKLAKGYEFARLSSIMSKIGRIVGRITS